MYSIKGHIEPVVERRAKNSKAILLTGPRQVGKSTLFNHLFSDANQVTFDDDLTLAQAETDISLFLLINPIPLMIDEGLDFDFDVFYYNGKDKKRKNDKWKTVHAEGEIDLIIQENGILYPIEIKMSAMPKTDMAAEFDVLDGIPDKKRCIGTIIFLADRKLYHHENLIALPLDYI